MTCSSNTTCRLSLSAAGKGLIAALSGAALLAAVPASRLGAASPQEAGTLIIEARELLSRGEPYAAQARLREAMDRGAPREAVSAYMGQALLGDDKPAQARRWLESGAFSPPSALTGFRTLAVLELQDGHMSAAAAAYDRALAIAPRDAGLWTDIARFRYRGGEHMLAIEAADHALALDPGDAAALRLQGELVRDREGTIPALVWFEKALASAPGDLGIMGEYAATLGEAGRSMDMLAMTRRILDLDPDNARAFYLQAVLAARAGKYGLARKLLRRTGDRMDGVPGAMLLEGALEIAAGNHALAVEALEPLVRAQPANARARDLLARALFLSGEYRLLTQRFGDVADAGGSAYLQTLVGRAWEQLGRRDLAAPLLDAASRVPPAIRVVAQNRPAGAMLASGDRAGVQALAAQWRAQNPGNYDNLALSGDIELADGNGAAAGEYYGRAARVRMGEGLMARRLQALVMAGMMADAVQLAENFLAANPDSTQARRAVAWLAVLSGDWPRARRLYEGIQSIRGQADVQLLSDLAILQARTGDAEVGVRTARRAYRLQRASPVAAQALAVCLVAAKGEVREASALLDKARAIMGDNPLLAEARRSLADYPAS